MATCCAKTARGACCTASGRARSALLLWGDPLTAAAHSRAFSFCGSDGVEIMEPLSFKGRRGSGIAGDRCAYADASLKPRWDWQKYDYSHRVWGRLLYNPEARSRTCGGAICARNSATAGPAAGCRAGQCQPHPAHDHHRARRLGRQQHLLAGDLPEPVAGRRGALPARIRILRRPGCSATSARWIRSCSPASTTFADELLKGERSGKYSPIEVAQWIEDYAAAAAATACAAAKQASGKDRPEYRRLAIDIAMQAESAASSARSSAAGCCTGFTSRPAIARRSRSR